MSADDSRLDPGATRQTQPAAHQCDPHCTGGHGHTSVRETIQSLLDREYGDVDLHGCDEHLLTCAVTIDEALDAFARAPGEQRDQLASAVDDAISDLRSMPDPSVDEDEVDIEPEDLVPHVIHPQLILESALESVPDPHWGVASTYLGAAEDRRVEELHRAIHTVAMKSAQQTARLLGVPSVAAERLGVHEGQLADTYVSPWRHRIALAAECAVVNTPDGDWAAQLARSITSGAAAMKTAEPCRATLTTDLAAMAALTASVLEEVLAYVVRDMVEREASLREEREEEFEDELEFQPDHLAARAAEIAIGIALSRGVSLTHDTRLEALTLGELEGQIYRDLLEAEAERQLAITTREYELHKAEEAAAERRTRVAQKKRDRKRARHERNVARREAAQAKQRMEETRETLRQIRLANGGSMS